MAQVTGIVFIKLDGGLLRSKEGASLVLGGFERTAQTGHSVYGPSERIVPSECEFTLAHVAGDDLIGLQNLTSALLEFETDTGDTYVVRDAFCTSPAKITGGEGNVEFTFQGSPAELS